MTKLDRNELTEALSALENLIHAEYHYVESLAINNDKLKDNDTMYSLMRNIHSARTEMMDQLAKSLPNIGPLWCTLKHLLLTRMSLMETAEKCGDKEEAELFLKWADQIHHIIKDMLFEHDFSGFKECSRCTDDKERK